MIPLRRTCSPCPCPADPDDLHELLCGIGGGINDISCSNLLPSLINAHALLADPAASCGDALLLAAQVLPVIDGFLQRRPCSGTSLLGILFMAAPISLD